MAVDLILRNHAADMTQVRVQSRPKVPSVPDAESVRIRYKPQGSSEEQAELLRFRCVLDPALSQLAQGGDTSIRAEDPVQELERSLVLRKPVSSAGLRTLNPKLTAWLQLVLGQESTASAIRIVIQDVAVVRDREAQLRIPFADEVSALVTLRVHLRAKTRLVPGSLTEMVGQGPNLELPLPVFFRVT